MGKLNTFQRNNLLTGIHLAAEIPSSSPELRAFVVIGAYVPTQREATKSSKYLNAEQDNLRFWIRKYEVTKHQMEMDTYLADEDLQNDIYLNNIQTVEALEYESAKYIQDFSIMEVAWKVDNPLP